MLKKIFFISFLLLLGTQGIKANLDSEAETMMADIGEKVVNILTDKSLSTEERTQQFQEILDTKFNASAIGKFVLGRYWKQATKQEKERFIELFKTVTASNYALLFKDYTSEKFEVLGSRPEKDGGVTVLSQIIRPNGQTIPIDWKIFEKKGELRIYDVILEGISMGITQRSEYASVIHQGGGTVQAIIQALERRAGGQPSGGGKS
jgi:phospholipid transport system substrate-binding protein